MAVQTFDWPTSKAFWPSGFELYVMPNTRGFTRPDGGGGSANEVRDMLGDHWLARIDLGPTTYMDEAAARSAFFDRLRGRANRVRIWHWGQPTIVGTLSGTLSLTANVLRGATGCTLQGAAPGATVGAGSMIGLGTHTVRVLADAVANGAGQVALEIAPKPRATIVAATATITLVKPWITCRLRGNGVVPFAWRNASSADGCSFELEEDF